MGTDKNTAVAFFAGFCEPNPGGYAAWGALIYVNGVEQWRGSGYCGFGRLMSSNVAEFTGAIAAVEEASKLDREIILRGSNTMIINQLAGKWKVRSPKALYVPYYEKAMLLVHSRRSHISFKLISPALNEECELISKKVLYEKGVVLIDSDGWRFDGEIYMPPTS